MKNLKKQLRKRSVEAYACTCGTPEGCIAICGGDFYSMQLGIQYNAQSIAVNVA